MQPKAKADFSDAQNYLMESDKETLRLEAKTDLAQLRRQALWCGVKPGMRVLDAGCGPGKTTALLHEMIQPGGSITGIDFSEERILYARKKYGDKKGIEFHMQDLLKSMEWLGQYDLVWVRFVLEYYRAEAPQIVKNLKRCVKPGGYLCLLDLDYNCLSHYELPEQIAAMLTKIMQVMEAKYNFDTYAGRKLYAFLYDNGFEKMDVELMGNNIIYGQIKAQDQFDWIKKIEVAAKKAKGIVDDYPGGFEKLFEDLKIFLNNPRRFTYSPLILCKGRRPLSD